MASGQISIQGGSSLNRTVNLQSPLPPSVNNNSVNVNNSNCWQSDCSGFRNPFNQVLNTTNAPTFAGGTFTGGTSYDVASGIGIWQSFTILGGIGPVATLNSLTGFFYFQSANDFPLGFANDDFSAQQIFRNEGDVIVRTLRGLKEEFTV